MIARKHLMPIALGVCLVGVPALGSLKHPVTRPNKAHGYTTVVVSLQDGSFVATEQGQGTHTGKYVTHIVGQMDAFGQVIWGEGYVTAANGDQLYVTMNPPGDSFDITDGTGRFEGATGACTAVASEMVMTLGPVAGTMTITSKSTIEGSITY